MPFIVQLQQLIQGIAYRVCMYEGAHHRHDDTERLAGRSSGFTLLELMVTVAVAGVLMTVAIPAWQSTVQRNTMTSIINDLVGDINFARSEAITRGADVSICASSNQSDCSGKENWVEGWIVSAPTAPPGNNLLRAHGPIAMPQISITKNTIGDKVTFGGSGFADKGAGTITLSTAEADTNEMTCIVISLAGRVRTETGYYGNDADSCKPDDEEAT